MTRRSVSALLGMVLRRWYLLVIFSLLAALGASVFAWNSYAQEYSMSITFIPARYEIDQTGYAVETYNFNDSITRAYTYSLLVVDEQIRDAVRKAVDFDISKKEYEDAVSASVNEDSAVVKININWKDELETTQLAQAIKAYLTHVIANSTNVGIIKWVDGYSTELHETTLSQKMKAEIFFIIGLIVGLCIGICLSLILGVFDKRVFELEDVRYSKDMVVIGIVNKPEKPPIQQSANVKKMKTRSRYKHNKAAALFFNIRLLCSNRSGKTSQSHKQMMSIAEYLLDQKNSADKKIVLFTSPSSNCETNSLMSNITSILAGNDVKILLVKVKNTLKAVTYTTEKPAILHKTPNVGEYQYLWNDTDDSLTFPKPVNQIISGVLANYDLVFIECPPLLQNIELTALMQGVDATLLVFEYGKTTFEEVEATMTALQRVETKSLWCVWNGTNESYIHKSYLPKQ